LAQDSKTFDKLLLNAIDEALGSLGEPAEQSIYFHIESKFNVTRSRIPERLEDFQAGLEKIFGLGARLLEILVMKNLYAKIKFPLSIGNSNQLEFVDYVNAARQCFPKKRHKAEIC
jgi:hypothetical protein